MNETNKETIARIIFVNKGNYNSSIEYNKLDIVRYQGKVFISKVNTNKGNIPSDDGTGNVNDSNWQLLANNGSYQPSIEDGYLV